MSKFKVPAITWGTSFANTLTFGYPVDNFLSYSKPREGSEWIASPSGVEDAWIVGRDHYLTFEARWIPTTNTASATGWDTTTTGFRAFLEWAQDKNQFRFIPDASSMGTYITSYLVSPLDETGIGYEPDGTRKVTLTIRNASSPYNGY